MLVNEALLSTFKQTAHTDSALQLPSSELLPTPFLRLHNGMVTYCSELIQVLATFVS